MASESGLAFLFTEGALVDAIRTGKWYAFLLQCIMFRMRVHEVMCSAYLVSVMTGAMEKNQNFTTKNLRNTQRPAHRHVDRIGRHSLGV